MQYYILTIASLVPFTQTIVFQILTFKYIITKLCISKILA